MTDSYAMSEGKKEGWRERERERGMCEGAAFYFRGMGKCVIITGHGRVCG
jgi:hypothetical protein